jgi:hypothetical protein
MAFRNTIIVFTLAFFLFNCQQTLAYNAVTLGKGDKAPYKGYLLDPEAEKAGRVAILENEKYKVIVSEQNELLKINARQLANREELIKTLNSKVEDNKLMNSLYFIGGAILGGLVINELKQ